MYIDSDTDLGEDFTTLRRIEFVSETPEYVRDNVADFVFETFGDGDADCERNGWLTFDEDGGCEIIGTMVVVHVRPMTDDEREEHCDRMDGWAAYAAEAMAEHHADSIASEAYYSAKYGD